MKLRDSMRFFRGLQGVSCRGGMKYGLWVENGVYSRPLMNYVVGPTDRGQLCSCKPQGRMFWIGLIDVSLGDSAQHTLSYRDRHPFGGDATGVTRAEGNPSFSRSLLNCQCSAAMFNVGFTPRRNLEHKLQWRVAPHSRASTTERMIPSRSAYIFELQRCPAVITRMRNNDQDN